MFVSYHHANDQFYRGLFEQLFSNYYRIFVSRSVQIGDLDPTLTTETLRQKIRDEYLRDTTVTVVLIGSETWKRKHVDWEISSSIRRTLLSSRSGLLGIHLPYHPNCGKPAYDPGIVPPRLADNQRCGFARIYSWNTDPSVVAQWIQEAFDRRNSVEPDNSYPHYVNNRTGDRWC